MTVSDVSIKAIRGRKGQARDANAFAQREVGQVAVGRGPHHGLVQIPLCAVELRLELVGLGLALLDIESAAGAGFQELRRLSQTLLRKLKLGFERLDLGLVWCRVDTKQDIAALQRRIGLDRNLQDFAGDIRHDRDRIARHERLPLRRAPVHRHEQADQQ